MCESHRTQTADIDSKEARAFGIRVAEVGCGHWGQNLLRNLSEAKHFELAAACDLNEVSLLSARKQYPSLAVTQNYDEILSDPWIQAIVIATFPISTHYELTRRALERGKHVLVEKPLASSAAQALELAELAERRKKVLMVDHTFLYTSAVRFLKQRIAAGEIGELASFDSVRLSPRLIPSDASVLWDLGPHDFSIMDHVCGSEVVSISAIGVRHLSQLGEDTAYVTVRFRSGLSARLLLSAIAAAKLRLVFLGGSEKTIIFDDSQVNEKVRICDRNAPLTYDPATRSYQLHGGWATPRLEPVEPLRCVVEEFSAAIVESRRPITDGYAGYRVVRLLEAAQQSIEQNGREVELGETTDRVRGEARVASVKRA